MFPGTNAGKDWSGFDVDLCRAMRPLILGKSGQGQRSVPSMFCPLLQSPDIDVVLRGLTWTFGREARSDVRFGPIVFYEGRNLLVPKRSNIQTARTIVGKDDLRLDRRSNS